MRLPGRLEHHSVTVLLVVSHRRDRKVSLEYPCSYQAARSQGLTGWGLRSFKVHMGTEKWRPAGRFH